MKTISIASHEIKHKTEIGNSDKKKKTNRNSKVGINKKN